MPRPKAYMRIIRKRINHQRTWKNRKKWSVLGGGDELAHQKAKSSIFGCGLAGGSGSKLISYKILGDPKKSE